jgi:acylphosphatase
LRGMSGLSNLGPTSPVRVRVVVTGRVQGVFFRDSCRDSARRERVGGWVRNRADGAVEAEFEGMPDAVDRVVTWCRTGPAPARVDAVEVEMVPPLGDQRFRIR